MDYPSILKQWGISFKTVLPEIKLCGSPERCAHRSAVQTQSGDVYVLEGVFRQSIERKKKIAHTVSTLQDNGLKEVHPYLKTKEGDFLVKHEENHWQIMPFVDGIALSRPSYATEEWRGDVIAQFLLDLRKYSTGLADDSFSISTYLKSLTETIKKDRDDKYTQYKGFFRFLDDDFSSLSLPLGFCHGDLHPLNAIWGKKEIRSVIDWEFVGNKPELYDVANLVSCVGIEDPNLLLGGLAPQLIKVLQKEGFAAPVSWKHFPELLIAVRAGWLSEWLRKNDEEMLDLESTYIGLLIENREKLRSFWHCSP